MEITSKICRFSLKVFKHIYKPSICYYSEGTVPLNESTLLGRIVLFMNNEYNKSVSMQKDEFKNHSRNDIVNIIDKIKLNQINHISNLKFEQLEELLRNVNSGNFLSNKYHFRRLMNVIDLECCSRLDYLDSRGVLRILSVFTQSMPNRITEYQYYKEALNHLMTYIDYLSKEELIQTIFYIGLQKKMKDAQSMLKTCLKKFSTEDINTLSVEELCIVCNSTFKTSTKITRKEILERVKQTLNDKLYLLKDAALFITFIKTIRHNKYQDADLLNTITCTTFFNKTYKYYSFSGLCHILALYGDYLFYDEEILKLFLNRAIMQLKESDPALYNNTSIIEQIRPKDITRLLWVLSTLGYRSDSNDIYRDVIVPKIKERIEAGLYKKDVEELVNSILYLWMLNHQAEDLILQTLTEENVNFIKNTKSQTHARLNLLLTCIFFENKTLFRKLKLKAQKTHPVNMQLQLEQRPNLVKVLAALKALSQGLPVNKFEITEEIPHLNIYGITGYTKNIYKTVYIEVLDNFFCIKNKKNMPIGPMQLKLRILRKKDEALIIVPTDITEELSHEELKEYLKSEIELLC